MGKDEVNNDKRDNSEDDTVLIKQIEGYEVNYLKSFFFWILCILSAGILLLLSYWYPWLYTSMTKSRTSLKKGSHLLLKGIDDTWEEIRVEDIRIKEFKDIFSDDSNPFKQFNKYVSTGGWIKIFKYRNLRYIYDHTTDTFVKPQFDVSSIAFDDIVSKYGNGVTQTYLHTLLWQTFGMNLIEIPIPSVAKLLLNEVLHPFYIFQSFSCAIWWGEGYIYYPIAIIFISTCSITSTIYYTRKNLLNLREMAKSVMQVDVLRFGLWKSVWSSELTPGDIIEISDGISIPCDCLLLSGEAVVNESMLTGESNPIRKQPLPVTKEFFNPILHKKFTLFCGTKVVQTKSQGSKKILAVVIRTGFGTTKGNLFNSILFPKPIKFKFYMDSVVFLIIMLFVALASFAFSTIFLIQHGYGAEEVSFASLDLITITVPPALPLVLTIGIGFAINRLRLNQIYCTSPQRVNYCGKLNLMCFDKTGTLTEDDLSVEGARYVVKENAGSLKFSNQSVELHKVEEGLLDVVVSTHSVSKINGVYLGHPVDVRMFEASKWQMEDSVPETERQQIKAEIENLQHNSGNFSINNNNQPETNGHDSESQSLLDKSGSSNSYLKRFSFSQENPEHPAVDTEYVKRKRLSARRHAAESSLVTAVDPANTRKIHVMRRFEFEPALQRMSVIIAKYHIFMDKDDIDHVQYELCVKGSPEAVRSLSTPESIPADFDEVLKEYTQEGLYVLGCAIKPLASDFLKSTHVESLKRDELEHSLTFVGFILFENKLKSETPGVIKELKKADIGVVMITGDNVLTGITVARKCEMIHPGHQVFIGDINSDNQLVYTDVDNYAIIKTPNEIMTEYYHSDNVEIALTGKAIKTIAGTADAPIFLKARIFARTTPEQKQLLCEYFMEKGYFVGMCGDGTNDCGALKAAHAGLALSDAEASVVAPFTSRKKSIQDVVHIIKEGRCALQTSFVSFKYMVLYPVIQLVSALRLYEAQSVLGDFQYLYDDVILVLPLAILMCYTEPWPKLSRRAPTSSLFNGRIMISLFSSIVLHVGMIIGTNIYLKQQSWYVKNDNTGDKLDDSVECYENFVTFTFANFCYVSTAVAFNTSKPFRKNIWTNIWFTLYLILGWAVSSVILLLPKNLSMLQMDQDTPHSFRWQMFIAAWATMIVAIIIENVFIEGFIGNWFSKIFKRKKIADYRHNNPQL